MRVPTQSLLLYHGLKFHRIYPWFFAITLISCSPSLQHTKAEPHTNADLIQSAKIQFDLSELDDEGLIGPPDGKVAISYEFCIPKRRSSRAKVEKIDPSIKFFSQSQGRVKCNETQYLCIGSSSPGGARVITKIADLNFVDVIARTYFE
jgi:hypothetical protein